VNNNQVLSVPGSTACAPVGVSRCALPCLPFSRALDGTRQGRSFFGMGHVRRKLSASREASKKGHPLGLVIALAATGGMVIGSAGTYFFSRPVAPSKQSVSPAAGGTPQAQSFGLPPQQQFKPAPQPPGQVPAGKVWSVEHGHWHDAPVALTTPAPAKPVPTTTLSSAPATVTPAATTTPAPASPAEKKE